MVTGMKFYSKDSEHLASLPIIKSYDDFSEKDKEEYELVATRWKYYKVIIGSGFQFKEEPNEIEIPKSMIAEDVLVALYSIDGKESNKVELFVDTNILP
ncbi:MAG: hypothetical protein ABFR90_04815 [Planctomycetota bacterium]